MSLRVAIDARLETGKSGGVEAVVLGLARSLSRLHDGDEEYLFLTFDGADDWIRPHLSGPCRPLTVPWPRSQGGARAAARARIAARAPGLRAVWRSLPVFPWTRLPRPRPSEGTVERAGVDLVHFTIQSAFLTDIPSIYHPHDLQHLHLSQYFSAREIAKRELHYRTYCDRAKMVVVTSRWARQDLVRQYGLSEEKVVVVAWAPITDEYPSPEQAELDRINVEYELPDRFILYPAQTWPHKNHAGLLEALALLRARGHSIPLVSTGHLSPHATVLKGQARRLGLSDDIKWLGFVDPATLRALYAEATAVVVPTRFEAASGPVWEAFAAGVPVACSNVTSLPEQVGDAALIFDPDDIGAMADAILALWTDAGLRRRLAMRAKGRVAPFAWDRTARTFRAHYRRLAGQALTDEDRVLISLAQGI